MYIYNIIPLMIYMWRCRHVPDLCTNDHSLSASRHVPDLCTNKHSLSAVFSLAQPRWAESRHPGWKAMADRPKHACEWTNSTQVLQRLGSASLHLACNLKQSKEQIISIWLAVPVWPPSLSYREAYMNTQNNTVQGTSQS